MRHVSLVVLSLLLLAFGGCNGSPTSPGSNVQGETPLLASGQWSTGSACLNVTEAVADLYSGCWHGHFTRPRVSNGTFTAEGTYRFEAGPVTNENGQSARFTGTITGGTLTLKVERTDPSSASTPPATFEMTLGEGRCTQLCV